MSATASGLLGWTLGDVTDGHPFCDLCQFNIYDLVWQLTSSKYIFFPSPWSINHWRSVWTSGHESLAIEHSGDADANFESQRTNGSLLREKRQHVDIDWVYSIENILSSTSFLVAKLYHQNGEKNLTRSAVRTRMLIRKQWHLCAHLTDSVSLRWPGRLADRVVERYQTKVQSQTEEL